MKTGGFLAEKQTSVTLKTINLGLDQSCYREREILQVV